MYDLWDSNGKCPPEQMAQVQISLTVPADLDQDFDVDAADLARFCQNWLATGCIAAEDCGRTNLVDTDDTVNLLDFAEFAEYWIWP
jgi:hypothetical protein